MNDIPQPLTPADCDCSGCCSVPFDVLVELIMSTFGLSSEAAIESVRCLASEMPFEISQGGTV